jgi:hypothetical protein
MIVLEILAIISGIYLINRTIFSAVRTFVLPRAAPDAITRTVFTTSRRFFNLRMRWVKSYEQRDAIMAIYAPLTLVLFPPVWLTLITVGYMGIYWGLGVRPWGEAFLLSGSSVLTLGFATADTLLLRILAFSEATVGLILVAILISYLPTMYAAFSRRETLVTLLDVRAGNPPSPLMLLIRTHRIMGLHTLDDYWHKWETWFAEVEESHTSLPALVFYRSPQPEYSWVIAAGTILDAAALTASTIDAPHNPEAQLCIRAGYLCLRRIADFFNIQHNPNPNPNDPISISRAEFDDAYEQMHAAGLPLKADREQAWRDFHGWRVNYDTVLLALSSITMAPPAMWSSDRAPIFKHAPLWIMRKNQH